MRPSGQANFATYLLVIGGVIAVYAAIIFLPPIIDNMSVREQVDIALTKEFNEPDENLVNVVILKLNAGPAAVGSHYEEDPESGELVERRGLGIPPEGVVIERDEAAHTMRITVDYSRLIRLSPTQKFKTMTFHVEKEKTYK